MLSRDTHTTAGFYDPSACSPLTNIGSPGLLSFDFSGCGPGYYLDARKQTAALEAMPMGDLVGGKYLTALQIDVHKTTPLDVYVTIDADSPDCGAGDIDREGFAALGPKSGKVQCKVSGPVTVDASVCQKVATDPTFIVAGRPGVSYGVDSMPATLYVTGPGGYIVPLSDYEWGQAVPVTPAGRDKFTLIATSGLCNAEQNLFAPATTDVLVYASMPSQGFSFRGWTDFGPTPIPQTPVHHLTDDTARTLPGQAACFVRCETVTFGEGIRIVGDAPRCPGSSEADNSFAYGLSIQVRADYWIGDRNIEKFTSGVAADQIYEDPATLDWYGYATVGVGTKVTALYQNSTQRTNTEIAKGFKFGAGIVAVVAPVVLGMWFPPVSMFFAAMGTIAGLSSLIPNGQGAAVLFDMLNPTKITACIARWGFNNTGSPAGQLYVGSMSSTGKTKLQAVANTKDLLTRDIGAPGSRAAPPPSGTACTAPASAGPTWWAPSRRRSGEGRSTLTGCLNDV